MRTLAFVLLLWLLSSCKSTQFVRLASAAVPKLDPSATIYVAMPEDGAYGAKAYAGSGLATRDALASAFEKHAVRVCIASAHEPREVALAKASELGCKYGVLPSITQWEDRATEWSGLPDRVLVQLVLVEVDAGREIDAVSIEGKSAWATFGGDHPEDLLAAPIGEYVDSLY